MDLADSVDVIVMFDEVAATDRDQAIEALLGHLAERSLVDQVDVCSLRDAIVRREELGPTGIGEGVAVPHAWHTGLGRMVAALGISRRGIDYPSIDGGPVHIVLLVLTPPDRAFEPRKQATFGHWLHHLRESVFRASLILADSPDDVRRLLERVNEAGP